MKNSWEKKHIFMVLHLGPADRHHICQNKLRDRNFGPQKFTQKSVISTNLHNMCKFLLREAINCEKKDFL